jgi:hypothetical protein
LGFAFGWTIFQALFMRDSAGGSFRKALANTFIPELLSMNLLMDGMIPTVRFLRTHIPSADNPATPYFWFVMSMGLLVGFIVAYPMNWWLVADHLKHGMMTVRPAGAAAGSGGHAEQHEGMGGMDKMDGMQPAGPRAAMEMGGGNATSRGAGDDAAFVHRTCGRRCRRFSGAVIVALEWIAAAVISRLRAVPFRWP